MNTRSVLKQVIATLNFPFAVPDFIIYSFTIYSSMDSSPYFPGLSTQIAKLLVDTNSLEDYEKAHAVTPGGKATQDRNTARLLVENDLRDLRLDVQKIANADPPNALKIIKSAGMWVKNPGLRGKQKNSVVDGPEEGTLLLTGEGSGPHNWRISTDEKVWTNLTSSRNSKSTAENLISGVVYYIQNRRMLPRNEKSEWSQSIKFRVK